MYKPAAKRRWGYFALPILHGDRLVGKLDAAADRKAGVLVVNAIHEDVPFTPRCATRSTTRSRRSGGLLDVVVIVALPSRVAGRWPKPNCASLIGRAALAAGRSP